ncbi:ABC transporter substrate-binding protein [Haloimpatiens sp. FM7315]|uniref:ABC transporter substrate-binding protein n=1 Tax=Haloimpatiens sp. FM7315 TaxID=3298609 RepID=UPI00370A2640
MNKKKLISIFMVIFIISNLCGCKSESKENAGQKEINICINIQDRDAETLLNYIKNEYEKKYPMNKININTAMNLDDISEGFNKEKYDMALTERTSIIELSRNGLICDISQIIENNKIEDRYFNSLVYCGIYGNKNYGLGIVPFPVEIVYNKKLLDKMDIKEPKNIEEFYKIVEKLNFQGKKIPVILPEYLDIYSILFTSIFNNMYYLNNFAEYYDSKNKYLDFSNEIQKNFNYINELYRKKIIKKDTFFNISVEQLQDLNYNETPIMIATFNKRQTQDSELIKDYEVFDFGNSFRNVIMYNPLICVGNNSLEKDEIKNFIKYIYSDEFQKKLCQQKYYTANVKLNKEFGSSYKKIVLNHIAYANKRNLNLYCNIPSKLSKEIKLKIYDILDGKYNGLEWKNAIRSVYK